MTEVGEWRTMRLSDFRSLVSRLSAEVPAEFLDGISEITVSPRAVPHPTRADIFTLGHCIPFHAGETGAPDEIQSRVVLYHGSFGALAELDADFDWRTEAWETLTHELRHHLEWRAREGALEAFDEAAEENFARSDGEPFDPLFHLSGESVAEHVYQVDDDFFLDHVVRRLPLAPEFGWHGRRYRAAMPVEATLPAFLVVEGVADPPPGELVLVFRRPTGLLNLLRQREPFRGTVEAQSAGRGKGNSSRH